MSPILFWTFAGIMLFFGILVVVNRSPVASALSLVVSFLGLAALFVTLDAYFIGIIQVLVYAGAVMVLFLFIIMLLDLKAEGRRRWNPVTLTGGAIISLCFIWLIVNVIQHFPEGASAMPALQSGYDDIKSIGLELFSNYNLPFQVIGVLLFVATIGVVVLSKRELK